MRRFGSKRVRLVIAAGVAACGLLLMPGTWLQGHASDLEIRFSQSQLARRIYEAEHNPLEPDYNLLRLGASTPLGLSLGYSGPLPGESGLREDMLRQMREYLDERLEGKLLLNMYEEKGCAVYILHNLETNTLEAVVFNPDAQAVGLAVRVEDMRFDIERETRKFEGQTALQREETSPRAAREAVERPADGEDENESLWEAPVYVPRPVPARVAMRIPLGRSGEKDALPEEERDVPKHPIREAEDEQDRQPEITGYRLTPQRSEAQDNVAVGEITIPGLGAGSIRMHLGILNGGPLTPMTRAITTTLTTRSATPTSIRIYGPNDKGNSQQGITYSQSNNHNTYFTMSTSEIMTIRRGAGANQRMDIELHNTSPVSIRRISMSAVNQSGDQITIRAEQSGAELNLRTTADESCLYPSPSLVLEGPGTLTAESDRSHAIESPDNAIDYTIGVYRGFTLSAKGDVQGISTDYLIADGSEGRVQITGEGHNKTNHSGVVHGINARYDITVTEATVEGIVYTLDRSGGVYSDRNMIINAGGVVKGMTQGAICVPVHSNGDLIVNSGGLAEGHSSGPNSLAVQAFQKMYVRGGTVNGYAHNGSNSSGVVTTYLEASAGGKVFGDGGGSDARAGVRVVSEGIYAEGGAQIRGVNAPVGIMCKTILAMDGDASYPGSGEPNGTRTQVVGIGESYGIQPNAAGGQLLAGGGAVIYGEGGVAGIQMNGLVQAALPADSTLDRPAIPYDASLQYGAIVGISDGTGIELNGSGTVAHGVRLLGLGDIAGITASGTLTATQDGEAVGQGNTGIAAQSLLAGPQGKVYARGDTNGVAGSGGQVGVDGSGGTLLAAGGIADAAFSDTAYDYPEGFAFADLPEPLADMENLPAENAGSYGIDLGTGTLAVTGGSVRAFGGGSGVYGEAGGTVGAGGALQALGAAHGLKLDGALEVAGGGIAKCVGAETGASAGTVRTTGSQSYLYGRGDLSGVRSTAGVTAQSGSYIVGESVTAEDSSAPKDTQAAVSGGTVEAGGLIHEIYNVPAFLLRTPPAYAINNRLPAVGQNLGSDAAKLQLLQWTAPASPAGPRPDGRDYIDYSAADDQGFIVAEADGLVAMVEETGVTLVGNAPLSSSGSFGRVSGSGTYRVTIRGVNLLGDARGTLVVRIDATGLWSGHDNAVFLVKAVHSGSGKILYDYVALAGSSDYATYRTAVTSGAATFADIPVGEWTITVTPSARLDGVKSGTKEVLYDQSVTTSFAFTCTSYQWLSAGDAVKNEIILDAGP